MYQIQTITADSDIAKALVSPKFSPGQIVATPDALAVMEENRCQPLSLLVRHLSGDWGVVSAEDAQMNDQALMTGSRLLSSYLIAPETAVWLITDQMPEGNVTTFLLPSNY